MQNQIELGILSQIRQKVNSTEKEDIYFRLELITPTKAKELLEKNPSNREFRKATLNQYTHDILNDRWKTNTAEPIKISNTGRILDGQHRLQSIINADKSLMLHIAYNLEDSVFDVLDTHAKRTAGDVLHINGATNGKDISANIRCYTALKEGYKSERSTNQKATNADILNAYNANKDFWENVAKYSNDWYRAFEKVLPKGIIGGIYAYLYQYNADKAFDFFEELCFEEKTKSESIRLLRKRLRVDKISQKTTKQAIKMAIIIKVWNYYVTNQNVKILKINPAEEFPQPLIGDLI